MIISLLLTFCAVGAAFSSVFDDTVSLQSFMASDLLWVANQTKFFWGWITDEDVQFWLFTRSNPIDYQVLKINDSNALQESNFNIFKKVKIVVHGWITDGNSFVPEIIKTAYLSAVDANIIVVDWSKAGSTKYVFASNYVAMVGRILTDFLKFLVEEGVSTDDIHLVGHSLGAHVVGIAGYNYGQRRQPIDAITGLDPAYPLFKYSSEEERLDKSDARHVEVIHSCAGYLGFPSPLGHIDFYPNGGRSQPGCGYDFRGTCAHNRAVQYFAESIVNFVPFTAVKCNNYDELYNNGYCNGTDRQRLNMSGVDPYYREEGVYYLKTKSELPFALGDPSNWKNNN